MSRQSSNGAIRLAVIGDFQLGKSSLVNCLLAKAQTKTGRGYRPTTDVVTEYPLAPGVLIVDTPGFDDKCRERTLLSEASIRTSDAVLFMKMDTQLKDHDERILGLVDGKPLIVVFNCWDRTQGSSGWKPNLPENVETCEIIQRDIERLGMADSVLHIGEKPVFPINVLWAQFGLGQPISGKQRDDIVEFAKTKLGLDLEESALRAEMLQRSGFLPVRDFLKNLPLEILKHVATNPQREIDRIVDRFAEELRKRWAAA